MRKTLAILAVVILVAIVGGIIAAAFIRTDFNQVSLNNIESITVHHNGLKNNFSNAESESEENKEVYNKLLELYKGATNQNVLVSLLSSLYSDSAKAKMQSPQSTYMNTSNDTYLEIIYKADNLPTIKINGENYIDESKSQDPIQYYKVWIKISSEHNNTFAKTTAYYNTNPDSVTESVYKVNYMANFTQLRNYIADLDNLL